jgi:hypothetical protein
MSRNHGCFYPPQPVLSVYWRDMLVESRVCLQRQRVDGSDLRLRQERRKGTVDTETNKTTEPTKGLESVLSVASYELARGPGSSRASDGWYNFSKLSDAIARNLEAGSHQPQNWPIRERRNSSCHMWLPALLKILERPSPQVHHKIWVIESLSPSAAPTSSPGKGPILEVGTMAVTAAPRSVSDATRFTPTMPHAGSKSSSAASAPGSSHTPSQPRFTSPSQRSGAPPPSGGGSGGSSGGSGVFGETPEQRVARLRAAHLAAKRAQVSRLDQMVSGGRRFFDSAHRVTVLGLLGFTGKAISCTCKPNASCS